MQRGVTFPQTEIGPDPDHIVRFAEVAEAGGYDFITVYDHVLGADTTHRPGWAGPYDLHSQFHEVFVLLGYLAARTSLELSTNILVLPQRQVALVAKQAAEIDVLTRGRFRLGLGVGWNEPEYEGMGAGFHDRGRRYDEQLEVLQRLWAEPSVTFRGEYHTLDAVGILPRPVQPRAPLWLAGGTTPRVLDRVGRLADGWLPMLWPGPELTAALDTIRRTAEAAGRDPDAIGWQGGVVVGPDTPVDDARRGFDTYRALGATHATVITMGAGRSPDQHLETIAAVADATAG